MSNKCHVLLTYCIYLISECILPLFFFFNDWTDLTLLWKRGDIAIHSK